MDPGLYLQLADLAQGAGREPRFEVISTGIGFVNILGDTYTFEEHRAAAQRGLELARERMASGEYDLVILDEAIGEAMSVIRKFAR